MLAANDIALKEWNVVCHALATGRQSILLRKGGIDEGPDGFRAEHGEFWLMPTRFHQGAQGLRSEAHDLWQAAEASSDEPGKIALKHYAVVDRVFFVDDLWRLRAVRNHHVLSDEVVEQRFHYRQPGLFVMLVRVFSRELAQQVTETPHMAGCKSWVNLSEPLATVGLKPVASETLFLAQRKELASALSDH